jgi:hypothetical protein
MSNRKGKKWPALVAVAAALLFAGPPLLAASPPNPDEEDMAVQADWKAGDQEKAKERAAEVVPFVDTVVKECLLCRQQKLRDMGLSVKDITHNYFLLDSPIIKEREDHYGPVRFMHSKHADAIQDCALCHHARPTDPEAKETVRCSACHQESFRTDHPDRIGLKAAYHQQCVDCHRNMAKGPVDCTGCHKKNVPDHSELVKLPKDPKPWEVTAECLRCHENAGEDMLTTAHWLWKGPSSYTLEHRKEVRHGKATTAVNNF